MKRRMHFLDFLKVPYGDFGKRCHTQTIRKNSVGGRYILYEKSKIPSHLQRV